MEGTTQSVVCHQIPTSEGWVGPVSLVTETFGDLCTDREQKSVPGWSSHFAVWSSSSGRYQ